MAAQARTQRIESEMQRVLAGLIAREVKDPRVGNVTITAVSVAADMGSATIFFTPFASSSAHEQVQQGLTRAAGFLRGELGAAAGTAPCAAPGVRVRRQRRGRRTPDTPHR